MVASPAWIPWSHPWTRCFFSFRASHDPLRAWKWRIRALVAWCHQTLYSSLLSSLVQFPQLLWNLPFSTHLHAFKAEPWLSYCRRWIRYLRFCRFLLSLLLYSLPQHILASAIQSLSTNGAWRSLWDCDLSIFHYGSSKHSYWSSQSKYNHRQWSASCPAISSYICPSHRYS